MNVLHKIIMFCKFDVEIQFNQLSLLCKKGKNVAIGLQCLTSHALFHEYLHLGHAHWQRRVVRFAD